MDLIKTVIIPTKRLAMVWDQLAILLGGKNVEKVFALRGEGNRLYIDVCNHVRYRYDLGDLGESMEGIDIAYAYSPLTGMLRDEITTLQITAVSLEVSTSILNLGMLPVHSRIDVFKNLPGESHAFDVKKATAVLTQFLSVRSLAYDFANYTSVCCTKEETYQAFPNASIVLPSVGLDTVITFDTCKMLVKLLAFCKEGAEVVSGRDLIQFQLNEHAYVQIPKVKPLRNIFGDYDENLKEAFAVELSAFERELSVAFSHLGAVNVDMTLKGTHVYILGKTTHSDISIKVPVEVRFPATFTVNLGYLYSIVHVLTGKGLVFDLWKQYLKVTSSSGDKALLCVQSSVGV